MPEMHLKQPAFTYSPCDHLLKIKKEFRNLQKQDIQNIFNVLDKPCFQHNMAYKDFKHLAKRTASDKALTDKAFNIAKNLNYDGYQRRLASMVCKFFDKNSKGSSVNDEIKQNEQLAK